jgi:signal transduction histidine kinase
VPALNAEIRRFEERTGITCEQVLPDPQPELRTDVATALYRICQEAMTNVSRHTQAAHVAVRLQISPVRATLEIEDDGRGFEAGEVGMPGALGLMGMVERAEALGGHVSFHRGAGGGTLVTADIPPEKPSL